MILTRPRGLSAVSPSTQQLQAMITQTANQYGVPPSLALAVAQKESSLNPNAVSPPSSQGVSSQGLFQLEPATAAMLGVTNIFDPQQNATGGIKYLSQLHNQYGNWDVALQAYNAGPGRVASGTVPASSYSYASSILSAAGMPQDGSASPVVVPVDGSIITPGGSPSDEVTAIYDTPDGSGLSLAGMSGGALVLILGGAAVILMMGRRRRSAS